MTNDECLMTIQCQMTKLEWFAFSTGVDSHAGGCKL